MPLNALAVRIRAFLRLGRAGQDGRGTWLRELISDPWSLGVAHVGGSDFSHFGDAAVAHLEDRDDADVLPPSVPGGDGHFASSQFTEDLVLDHHGVACFEIPAKGPSDFHPAVFLGE